MLPASARIGPGVFSTLVALNFVPLIGVLIWHWQSFDLVFLYWMENVTIGIFCLARMVIRPYGHALELVFPLAIAPFFLLHYGAFCWGHGSFVVGLFADEHLRGLDLLPATLAVLSTPLMLLALIALALIQAMGWVRDVRRRGLGADSVRALMVEPYHRIVILHVTILGAGFALEAADEPVLGLVILIIVKTAFDLTYWRKDRAAAHGAESFTFTDRHLAEMHEKFPRPVVTVNGREKEFASFAALKASSEFRIARALMRIIGAAEELRAMTTYVDQKIAEERDGAGSVVGMGVRQ